MNLKRKPDWINKKINFKEMNVTGELLSGLDLHTVCHQARCPNISECFKRGTATFLILGDTCTRNCSFCNIKNGTHGKDHPEEHIRIAEAVKRLNLKYVIITSVTRDDKKDGGAKAFADTIKSIKELNKNIQIEVLTPDFNGSIKAVKLVVESGPGVYGHNIETVPSLYNLRNGADYNLSMGLLNSVKKLSAELYTKSSIMLGLGETHDEILEVFRDLRKNRCDFLSIGQYLQPNKNCIPVKEYIEPEKFQYYKDAAMDMGFLHVESGVYVRSSYMADRYF